MLKKKDFVFTLLLDACCLSLFTWTPSPVVYPEKISFDKALFVCTLFSSENSGGNLMFEITPKAEEMMIAFFNERNEKALVRIFLNQGG